MMRLKPAENSWRHQQQTNQLTGFQLTGSTAKKFQHKKDSEKGLQQQKIVS